jgi:hypothetical protein
MRPLFCGLIFVALAFSACTTKSGARRDAEAAFQSGQQLGQQQQQPVVFFRGYVRRLAVPWVEGLTLAQALVQADYTGALDPRLITVTRGGELHRIDVRRLLSGREDPLLEPGDLVEIQR